MSSGAKIATKVHVNSHLSLSDSVAPRLHPEISNAIKRQHQTSGIDYVTSKAMVGGNKDKRRLHSLTVEFPEIGFPTVSHRLPKQGVQTVKVKKKAGLLGVDVMSRSQTSINLTAPSFVDKAGSGGQNADVSTNPSVTDITCLQFADTLFSPSNSHHGLFGFSVNKTKYMDYLEECITAKEKPIHKDSEMKEKRDKAAERINAYRSPRVAKGIKSSLVPASSSKTEKATNRGLKSKNDTKCSSDESQKKDKQMSLTFNEKITSPLEESKQTNANRKSILKPGGIAMDHEERRHLCK